MSPRVIVVFCALVATFLAIGLTGCAEPPAAESIKKAQAELDAGKPADAIRRLERAYQKNPKNDDLTEALAFAHLNGGDAARAGELFNELGLNKNADEHLYAAQAYKKANQPDKAIEAYRLYLLNEPKQATPWNELGDLYMQAGNTEEGLTALVKAYEIAPNATLSSRIAQVYQTKGNAAQSERYLQSALRLARTERPQDSEPSELENNALVQLTQLALDQKRPMEAERHLRQLERDFPNAAQLPELKERLAKMKKPAAADKKKDAQKPQDGSKLILTPVVEFLPILPPSNNPNAKPKSEQLVEVLTTDKENAAHWAALGAAKAKAGEFAWAEAAYLEAMRLQPGQPQVIIAYLEVFRQRHAAADYLDETQRQLQKYPEIPELYLVSARGYRDQVQNKRNARAIFSQFLKKFPNHPDAAAVKAELEAIK